jgi:hypothetical protein
MFKHATLAAIGLTAALGTAHADTIITSHGPYPGLIPYSSPSFERLVEMCDRFGLDCSAPGVVYDDSPEARADAEKRLQLYAEDYEEFLEEYDDHVELLPAPILPRPFGFYGYPAPRVLPLPRPLPHPLPRADLFGFGHRFDTLPYPTVPPHVLPYGSFPRGPLIPWPSL